MVTQTKFVRLVAETGRIAWRISTEIGFRVAFINAVSSEFAWMIFLYDPGHYYSIVQRMMTLFHGQWSCFVHGVMDKIIEWQIIHASSRGNCDAFLTPFGFSAQNRKKDHSRLTDEPVNNLMLTAIKPLVRDSDDIINRVWLFRGEQEAAEVNQTPCIGSIILKDSSIFVFWR